MFITFLTINYTTQKYIFLLILYSHLHAPSFYGTLKINKEIIFIKFTLTVFFIRIDEFKNIQKRLILAISCPGHVYLIRRSE
jgi:hypothetical protein